MEEAFRSLQKGLSIRSELAAEGIQLLRVFAELMAEVQQLTPFTNTEKVTTAGTTYEVRFELTPREAQFVIHSPLQGTVKTPYWSAVKFEALAAGQVSSLDASLILMALPGHVRKLAAGCWKGNQKLAGVISALRRAFSDPEIARIVAARRLTAGTRRDHRS